MEINFCAFIDNHIRVDIYLSALFVNFSRSYIQKMIDRSYLKINNKIINKNIKIKNKDEIKLNILIEQLDLKAENMPLDIVFENSNFAVINKDAWINTHPVPWEFGKENTLVNALLYHIKDLAWIGWVERPWIVHRLDKNTSWLILIAKNDKTMQDLQEIIKNRKINKYYIAIVNWIVLEKLKIESYIWRDPNNRLKMTTKNWINEKLAISYATPIEYIDNKYTILKVKIETWRTHQIRVHLSSIWFPILGDNIYWNIKANKEIDLKYWLKRQALHAYNLDFELNWKKYNFIWELKDDMKKIIKNYIKNILKKF